MDTVYTNIFTDDNNSAAAPSATQSSSLFSVEKLGESSEQDPPDDESKVYMAGDPSGLSRLPRIRVRTKLPDGTFKPVTVIIDSGSVNSLVNPELVTSFEKLAVPPISITGFNGAATQFSSEVIIPIYPDAPNCDDGPDRICSWRMLVAPTSLNLPADTVLLGFKTLSKMHFKLDSETIHFGTLGLTLPVSPTSTTELSNSDVSSITSSTSSPLTPTSTAVITGEELLASDVDYVSQLQELGLPWSRIDRALSDIEIDKLATEFLRDIPTAKMQLATKHPIIKAPYYPLRPQAREALDSLLGQLRADGTITRIAYNPRDHSTPVFVTKKKQGGFRLLCDFRNLNARLELPRGGNNSNIKLLPHCVPNIPSGSYLAVIDCKDAFYQVPIEEDVGKNGGRIMVIRTGVDEFHHFEKLPQGLKCSPAYWENYIQLALSILIGKPDLAGCGVCCYVDDIMLWGVNEDHCRLRLTNVRNYLLRIGINLPLHKTQDVATTVTMCGMHMSATGWRMSDENVQKLQSCLLLPETIEGLRSALGIVQYLRSAAPSVRDFVEGMDWFYGRLSEFNKCRPPPARGRIVDLWTVQDRERWQRLLDSLDFTAENSYQAFYQKLKPPVSWCVLTDASETACGASLYLLPTTPPTGEDSAPWIREHGRLVSISGSKFSETEKRYTPYERETLGIVRSLRGWREIILSTRDYSLPDDVTHLYIYTDNSTSCSRFESLSSSTSITPSTLRGRRWLSWWEDVADVVLSVPTSCRPIKGKQNTFADALSRMTCFLWSTVDLRIPSDETILDPPGHIDGLASAYLSDCFLADISVGIPERGSYAGNLVDAQKLDQESKYQGFSISDIYKVAAGDTSAKLVRDVAKLGSLVPDRFRLDHDSVLSVCTPIPITSTDEEGNTKITYADKWVPVLPLGGDFRKFLADGEAARSGPLNARQYNLFIIHDRANHPGYQDTVDRVRADGWWPTMRSDIRKWIGGCEICLGMRGPNVMHEHAHLPRPSAKNVSICVDFKGPLPPSPNSAGPVTAVLTIVEDLTGFVTYICTKDMSAQSAATAIGTYVADKGLPRRIHSDRGVSFVNELWTSLSTLFGVKLSNSPAYSPSSNGRAESHNKHLARVLRAAEDAGDPSWHLWVPLAATLHNHRTSSTSGISPYQLMYGESPITPISTLLDRATAYTPEPEPIMLEQLRSRLRCFYKVHLQKQLDVSAYNKDYRSVTSNPRGLQALSIGDQVLWHNPNGVTGPYEVISITKTTATLARSSGPTVVSLRQLQRFVPDPQRATLPGVCLSDAIINVNPDDVVAFQLPDTGEYMLGRVLARTASPRRTDGTPWWKVHLLDSGKLCPGQHRSAFLPLWRHKGTYRRGRRCPQGYTAATIEAPQDRFEGRPFRLDGKGCLPVMVQRHLRSIGYDV